MEFKKEAMGNNYLAYFPLVDEFPSADDVVCTWKQSAFDYVAETESTKGFRAAQLGAIFAVKSHWTISEAPVTVVMPTGTGKTETMFATIVSECRKRTLIQTVVTSRPNAVPYGIDFPIELYLSNSNYLKTGILDDRLLNFDITLTVEDDSSPLTFSISNGQMSEEFTLDVSDKHSDGFVVTHKSGDLILVSDRKKERYLSEYFCENPPEIRFCNQSSLDGNLLTRTKVHETQFSNDNITVLNWDGIDIKKESQWQTGTGVKANDSIQYKVISMLKSTNKYTVIFDDDDKGEIADVVAIIEESTAIRVELYHCKFSGGGKAGFRVKDLYEVCGQAEKCVNWYPRIDKLIDRLIERESRRLSKPQGTRFEVGDGKTLQSLKKKLKFFRPEFSVYIVQPGVDSKRITQSMHDVLCSTSSYLKETYAINLQLICS